MVFSPFRVTHPLSLPVVASDYPVMCNEISICAFHVFCMPCTMLMYAYLKKKVKFFNCVFKILKDQRGCHVVCIIGPSV